MKKRTEAQVAAERKYEKRRTKTAIKIRLDKDDLKRLDEARGDDSRAKYVEEAVLDRLG